MTRSEAKEIIKKDRKCFQREGSAYCDVHPGCMNCSLYTKESELDEAKAVLGIKEIRKYKA